MGMGTETEPRIFISYARSDGNTAAARLRALLERHGFALWQDLVAMEGGEDWWRQIERVIKTKSLEYFILVMTPNAVASPIVRKEWRLARQEGKCVIPIVGSPVLDFSAMPPWMRRIDFIDPEIPERCTRLIRRLESPCIHRRVPFMAGDLPGDFVARPVELEAVVDRLLDQEKEEPVAITSVLTGAGGFGKTVLARAVCHDALIQDAFDGGILWATLGEQPGDLIVKVVDLIEVLSGQRPGFQGMEAATSRLAEALGEGRYLIVVDDVWDAAHAQPFLSGGPNCARLITTRDRKTLPADAQEVTVDAMRRLEARQLLGSGLPTEHDNALDALARRLGEWPLALKLANGVLQRRTRRREPMLAALRHVNEALDEGGLTAFDANSAEDRADAVAATLAPSMKALTVEWPEGPARFAELTVFAEDADVPLSAIAALWAQSNMRKQQAERLCLELFDLSLLLSLDLEKRQIRLHDVIRGYFLPDDPAARRCLHRRLLNAYRGTCRKGWESGPNDGYFFQWLTYHLREAGETNELRRLLLDYRWLAAKLAATDIAALLGDYDQLDDDEGAKLVEGALRLSAHALGKEPSQLAPHLTGRLRGCARPAIAALIVQIANEAARPWLSPRTASLMPPGGALIRTLAGHAGWVTAVTVAPDGSRAVSGAMDKTLRIWDLQIGREVGCCKGHAGTVSAVAVTPDGTRAVSGSYDRSLRIWDLKTCQEIGRCEGHTGRVAAVAVTPDGTRAVSGSHDRTLRIWDLKTCKEIGSCEGHTGIVAAVAVTPDGTRAVSGSFDETLKIWNLRTNDELSRCTNCTSLVTAVAISPDGRKIVSGSADATLQVWDLETGKEISHCQGHTGSVCAVSVTPDGRRAVSGGNDGTMRIWDLQTGKEVGCCLADYAAISAVAVAPDCRTVVSGAYDRTLRIWALPRDNEVSPAGDRAHAASAAAVSPDGKKVVFAFDDETLRIREAQTGKEIGRCQGPTDWVGEIAVTPDGLTAVSLSVSDGALRAWDLQTGQEISRCERVTDWGEAVAVTPDGRKIVSGSHHALLIWDLKTGKEIGRCEGHTGRVLAIGVTPDGSRVVTASEDRTLRIWDLDTRKEIGRCEGHTGMVTAVAVMHDGRRAISASADGSLRTWDLQTGKELGRCGSHNGAVTAVAVTPNGRKAIFVVDCQTLQTLDLYMGEPIAVFATDARVRAIACAGNDLFVAGSADGAVHILELMQ